VESFAEAPPRRITQKSWFHSLTSQGPKRNVPTKKVSQKADGNHIASPTLGFEGEKRGVLLFKISFNFKVWLTGECLFSKISG